MAACIATGKRLLVFDEPTSGLDLGSMRTVAALVRRLADEGRAVLVVTHDLEFIGQACDKAVRVEAGRIAAEAVVEGDLQAVRELLAKGDTRVAEGARRFAPPAFLCFLCRPAAGFFLFGDGVGVPAALREQLVVGARSRTRPSSSTSI